MSCNAQGPPPPDGDLSSSIEVAHTASCGPLGLVRDSFSPQSLPCVSGRHSYRSRRPRSHCSESERLPEALSNLPHRFPCSRCGAPTPATPHAHCHRRRIHTPHAPEPRLRPQPLSSVRHYREMTPRSRGRRFPALHWRGTYPTEPEVCTTHTSLT